MNTIGERLSQALKAKQMSAYTLAKQVGISESTISRILRNQSVPTIATLTLISRALDINAQWLKDGIGSKDFVASPLFAQVTSRGSISARLQEFFDYYKMDDEQFCQKTGIPFRTVFGVMNGAPVTTEFLTKSLNTFHNLNINWLLTGAGMMFTSNTVDSYYMNSYENSVEIFGRLFQYISERGLNLTELIDALGKDSQWMSKVLEGKAQFENEDILRLMALHQDLNGDWLVNGKGPMTTAKVSKRSSNDLLYGGGLGYIGETSFERLRGEQYSVNCLLIEKQDHVNYMDHFRAVDVLSLFSKHAISLERIHVAVYRSFRCIDVSMDNGSKNSILFGDIVTGRRLDITLTEDRSCVNPGSNYVFHLETGINIRQVVDFNHTDNRISVKALNEGWVPTNHDFSIDSVREIYLIEHIARQVPS